MGVDHECPHLGEEEQIDLLQAALDRGWKEAQSLQEEAHYRQAMEREEMANTSGLLMHRSARYQAVACTLGIRLLRITTPSQGECADNHACDLQEGAR